MLTKNTEETKRLAKSIAKEILSAPLSERKGAFIVALKGDLGGGKTTFVQGFAKGLGIKSKILSPTFNILKKYKIAKNTRTVLPISKSGEQFSYFYHFDCYRIEKPEEIKALGFDEIISDSQNIVAIEWAERIKDILPKGTKWINFKFVDETTRSIDIF